MNVIQIQEALKGMPLEQLVREMQMPSGQAPQFLVLGEIARRKQMEQEFAQRQGQPQTTVAEDAVTAAGVPQQGIASAARAMAPKTDMAMNTAPTQQAPVQGMADGGYVRKMQVGGFATSPEYDYAAFLREMGLNDTPDARDAFRRYQNYVSAQQPYRAGIPRPDVVTRAPAAPSLSDVSADISAFLPTSGGAQPSIPAVPDAPVGGIAALMGMPSAPSAVAAPQRRALFEPLDGGVADGIFDASDNLGYDPASMTAEEILAAAAGPTAPLPTNPRAAAAREARQSRIGMDTSFEAAMRNRLDGYTYPPIPPAVPEGMEMELARAALGEEALSGRLGMDTAEAATLRNRGDILARSGLRIPGAMPPSSMPMGGLEALMASRRPPDEIPPSLGEIEAGVLPEYIAPPANAPQAEEVVVEPGVVTTPAGASPMPRDDRAPAGTYTGTGVSRPVAAPSADRTGGGIAAAMSPFETELTNLLQQREKRAEQDKWLALAQTGLALMGSRQPTFAGALGEAGAAGLQQFQQGRAQYDKDRLELAALLENTRLARAKLAAAGRGGGGLTAYQAARLGLDIEKAKTERLNALVAQRDALLDMEGLPPTDERGLREYRAVQAEIEALRGTADAGEEDELFADLTASD